MNYKVCAQAFGSRREGGRGQRRGDGDAMKYDPLDPCMCRHERRDHDATGCCTPDIFGDRCDCEAFKDADYDLDGPTQDSYGTSDHFMQQAQRFK